MSYFQRLLARNGVRVGALYDCDRCRTPDDVAKRFGLRPIGESWREVNRTEAIAILHTLLERDLAYDAEADSAPVAGEVSAGFVQEFSDDARFFTNAEWRKVDDRGLTIGDWASVTDSTFDSGILVLHNHRIGVYWIEDED